MKKWPWLIGACALTLLLGGHVRAQNSTILGYGFTAPVLALPGQTISVCAFDWFTGPVVAGPVTVTLQIVDVALGGAVIQRSVSFPISPFDPYHATPCIQLKVPANATSAAGPGELIAGAITLYPPTPDGTSGTPPPALLTASVNITGSVSVQTIPIPIQSLSNLASFGRFRP